MYCLRMIFEIVSRASRHTLIDRTAEEDFSREERLSQMSKLSAYRRIPTVLLMNHRVTKVISESPSVGGGCWLD